MKTVVVYYSYTGNNEILANELQARLGCEVYKITELKRRGALTFLWDMVFGSPEIKESDRQFHQYDHVILSAPVWMGKIATPLKTFIRREKDHIKAYSFITVCGSRGNKQLSTQLTKLANKKPTVFTELAINDILTPDKKNKIKYTSGYRLQKQDLIAFDKEIQSFLKEAIGETNFKITDTKSV